LRIVTVGAQTGVLQDRVILSVSQGDVMMDEQRLRAGSSAATQMEQNEWSNEQMRLAPDVARKLQRALAHR
jgi:hypothetical protein